MFSDGQIKHVQCKGCGESFPVYVFVADTDMVTNGWVSFTGTEGKDIVLAELSAAEARTDLSGVMGPGYKHVKITFQEQTFTPDSERFQDFLKVYKPPIATYECIYCGGSASETCSESQQDFMAHGKISTRNGT
jgi:hypothetical protein